MSHSVRNLLIAVALAFVGIILVTSYVKGRENSILQGKKYVEVLVAKKDIPAGTTVKQLKSGGFLDTKKVEKRSVDPSALSTLKGKNDLAVNTAVFAGQQVTAHAFGTSKDLAITDALKGNERAVTIPIGSWQSVSGFLKTGDRVDLFASGKVKEPGATNEVSVTWVVARNVEIIKVPDDMLPPDTESNFDPLKIKGDPLPYIFKVTDKVVQNILWSLEHSFDNSLTMAARGTTGSQATKLPPEVTLPPVN